MKLYVPLIVALLAAPAFAQTETDSAADKAEAEMAQRTGTVFFNDEAMTTMRPAEEIATQWATMSAEDQAALRARCDAMVADVTEMEPSKGDGSAEGTVDTGAADNDSSGTTTAEDLGYMADPARMQPICDMISSY